MAPIKTKKKVGKKAPARGKKRGGCGCRDVSESSSSESSSESSSYTSSSDYTSSSSESESDSSDAFECPCAPTKKRGGKKVQAARQAKLVNKKKPTKRRAKLSTSYCSSDYDSSDDSFQCPRKPGRKCKA
ncbi:pre-mRNA-splicing factor CWC22 homolog [Diachasma alloeum]|uniref:pre-mRNA-splicing factor CWC22 homolog n=1 Tax=Diachasma alloeum TaxID=454923 RepID=UPI0007382F1F|nr:pre-mRNA-splicing factor CWC22 homolog [Diachasma alloeum]